MKVPQRQTHTRKSVLPKQASCKSFLFRWILLTGACCLVSFYCGLWLGLGASKNCSEGTNDWNVIKSQKESDGTSRFPSSTNQIFTGMSRVTRSNFSEIYDVGAPVDPPDRGGGNEEVIILHSQLSEPRGSAGVSAKSNGEIPLLSPQQATEHCDTMKVMLTTPNSKKECLAIMGNYESYHLQKWMRLPVTENKPIQSALPLRHVSKSHKDNGRTMQIPSLTQTLRWWSILRTYFQSIDSVLKELRPLVEKVAVDNAVIVMVCNHGQSELLMNFVCNSRAKGLDISQVLVFATDIETKELADGLGLTTFYDEKNFGSIPSEAAKRYGDKKFMGMMLAKLYCVQMVSMLQYDVLFQDVDVIWFKNPLPLFQNTSSPYYDFDIYFQDDGARTPRYAPFSPNSGFYFVRFNRRTEYFFSVFLRMGDMIIASGSHQSAMNQVLSEHVSWRGLRAKVFQRDGDELPGGYHFNMRSGKWMKDYFAGKKNPYIFHMSWTANKDNKLLYYKQMGEWYTEETCIGSTAKEIAKNSVGNQIIATKCCLADPKITCHYRDKPSKHPCPQSPNIDKGRPSFW